MSDGDSPAAAGKPDAKPSDGADLVTENTGASARAPEAGAAAGSSGEPPAERSKASAGETATRTVPSGAPGVPTGQTAPSGRPLLATPTSGGTVIAPDVNAGSEGALGAIVNEFTDQISNPQHPLGPFEEPHSTMIAGIEEHIGYVPGWLILLCIAAVLLAMIMWYPTGSPAGGTY